jgi:hypothetical protein
MTRARHRTPVRLGAVLAALMITLLVPFVPRAGADEPVDVPWTNLLPPLPAGYEPTRENLCVEGQPACVDVVIQEMQRRMQPLLDTCDHDLIFAFAYLRTTEEYRRTIAEEPGFFQNPAHINHQDTVFAAYYFDGYDAWHGGDRSKVAPAWRVAFDSADRQAVSSTGNLFLAMNAHINRDMPFVLESIGLTNPDGGSGKPDHDKSNEWLVDVTEPMLAEGARRFDPTLDDGDVQYTSADTTLNYQLVAAWRERAWRNAERLHAARQLGQVDYGRVAAEIEAQAVAEANAITAATQYLDPGQREARNAYCTANRGTSSSAGAAT